MGGGQRRRDQRFAGDRLAHSSSQESRRRLIDQMNRVRDRDANEARLRESEREVHDRGINNTNERSRNQSRGLNSRGLATNQPNRQVLNRDGNEASTDDESEPLSTDNDNNSGITSSQIDHAIRPYHGAPVEDSTDPSVYSVPETTEASRNIARRSHSTLDELNNRFFRTIWNETALSLSESGQSRHDAQLEILRTRFVHIMQQNPEGIQSRRDWRMAESIFDRAYVRARERWSATPMWNAVWNNDEARDRLLELHNEGIIHIRRDAETGLPTGAPRMQQYNPSNGRYPWVPINIDHAVPLERNPWGVLEPDNLVATTAHINQRTLNYLSRDTPFLMSVDRFGGSMQDLENQIENFVMSNGLSRRRRASASHLHERFGSIAESVLLQERNRNSGNRDQTVSRGLFQALSLVLDLLLGSAQSSIYENTVLRMRDADRRRRHRRSHNQFNI
ncbi:MAG: hypothetical protein AB8B56_09895, partial [Crocinitomicaceae bacterium]